MDKAVLAVVKNQEKNQTVNMLNAAAKRLAAVRPQEGQTTAERLKKADKRLAIFEVQFNPATLKIRTDGGRAGLENCHLPQKPENVAQAACAGRTQISFELEVAGEGTRENVNGLMGLLRSDSSRQVLFAWGSMSFPGQVAQMSAGYTMFDHTGKPVRGKISMTVALHADTNEQKTYWEKALGGLADS